MVFVVCCLLRVVCVSVRGLRCLSSLLKFVVCCCLLCCCCLSRNVHDSFVICCLLRVVWCKFLVVELCSLFVVRCGVCVV